MSTYYRIVISAPLDKPITHLPITLKGKFRVLNRALEMVRIYQWQNRNVCLVEFNSEGIVSVKEYQPLN